MKMTNMRGALAAAVGLACLGSCSVEPAPIQTIEPGDAAFYASYVQPYVEVSCASLDCHGDRGRPLRLYSELGLRRAADLRTTPISMSGEPTSITPDELEDNRLAFAAVALASASPESHHALLKPLATSQGGIAHKGGAHWQTKEEPGYRCLLGYLVGSSGDSEQHCADALDAAEQR